MKKLPPNKRNQLIGVVVVTMGLICAVYFLLINPQIDAKNALIVQVGKENAKLKQYRDAGKQIDSSTSDLVDAAQQLEHAEEDVASGDLYAWTYDIIRRFKAGYRKVEIGTIGQPVQGDCELIGNFPYKQIRFSVDGTAFYHDLGKFVSDFENKFPHCRVVNLSVDPSTAGEKLNFKMDIVALVKPNA